MESPEPEIPTPEAFPSVRGDGYERASSSRDEDEGSMKEESKRGSHGESSSSDDDDDGAGPSGAVGTSSVDVLAMECTQ